MVRVMAGSGCWVLRLNYWLYSKEELISMHHLKKWPLHTTRSLLRRGSPEAGKSPSCLGVVTLDGFASHSDCPRRSILTFSHFNPYLLSTAGSLENGLSRNMFRLFWHPVTAKTDDTMAKIKLGTNQHEGARVFLWSVSHCDYFLRAQRRSTRFSWVLYRFKMQKWGKTMTSITKRPMKTPATSTRGFSNRQSEMKK